jgi:hypothetical protein
MDAIVVAVVSGFQRLGIDAVPDNVGVLSVLLGVKDDGALMTFEAKRLLKRRDRLSPLLIRQDRGEAGADTDVIKRLGRTAAASDSIHLGERTA